MNFARNTRNIRRLGPLGLAALLALMSGCFSEPVEVESSATGGTCDPGTFSCPCFESSCEPGLRCTPSDVCISEMCTPGESYCECASEGMCGSGFECVEDLCLPPGGSTTTVTSGSTETGTSTTGTSSTTASTASTTSSSTVSATSNETETTEVDTTDASTTESPINCAADSPQCAECFSCTHDNECGLLFTDCENEPGCITAVSCMQGCAVEGLCFDDCCESTSPGATGAALALQTCRQDTCIAGACKSFSAFTCN